MIVFQWVMRGLYGVLLCVFCWFLWRGSSFYLTAFEARPHHEDYGLFRPAGTYGLTYGIVGSCAMLLLLLYSVRRRTRLLGRKIPIKYWLDVHIFLGVLGPLFVLLHTSFKWGGLVSLSFWSMVGVGLSGLLGRYLYLQIPRSVTGEVARDGGAVSEEHLAQVMADYALSAAQQESLRVFLRRSCQGSVKLFAMLGADLLRFWHQHRLFHALRVDLAPDATRRLFQRAKQLEQQQRRHFRLHAISKMFHQWHVIHRPFAVIMYLIMFLHIAVALLFGISWRTV